MLLLTVPATALYEGDPFVTSPHSFSDIGPHGTSYVALEFYAGWCGHCQAFAPTWKEVARHACAAAPRLQFVAVDCASDFLLCQEMNVPSFPTIRLFGPGLPALGLDLSACRHGCDTSAEVLDEVVRPVRMVAGVGDDYPNLATNASLDGALLNAGRPTNRGGLLADVMGLGKTVEAICGAALRQAICASKNLRPLPVVIVSPNVSVLDQWSEAPHPFGPPGGGSPPKKKPKLEPKRESVDVSREEKDAMIAQLVGMGYPTDKARRGLRRSGWDVSAAVERIENGGAEK